MTYTSLVSRHVAPLLATGCAAIALLAAPASAETLNGALAKAYANNPTLTAARAGQRAVDENVPIQRSQGLPNVGLTGSYSEQIASASNNVFSPDRSVSLGTSVSVPLYQGGVVKYGTKAAETRVTVGQAELRGTEATVFSAVVGAYMDVLRDEAVVGLTQNNVQVLTVNLRATRDRFEIGDLTRTDVAQSEARLALAQSQLESAQARLISSRENYIRIVGEPPVDLQAPPALPGLPQNVGDAVSVALVENPDLEAATGRIKASGYDVRATKGARMPRVSATASGGYVDYLGTLGSSVPNTSVSQGATTATAGVSVTMPLFQGGRPSALVRQAQARQSQAMEQAVAVERSTVAQTRSSYAAWNASNAVIRSSEAQVAAATLSLEGVRAENSVGTRTILEILNAEQELLNARVQLVTAKRDAYVAGFSLLAAMGRAEAADLRLDNVTLYDPAVNYRRVRNQWWDWADDKAPTTVATPTAATPAQTANIRESDTSPPRRPARRPGTTQ